MQLSFGLALLVLALATTAAEAAAAGTGQERHSAESKTNRADYFDTLEQQLDAELASAKHVRQQWHDHIAMLEARLSSLHQMKDEPISLLEQGRIERAEMLALGRSEQPPRKHDPKDPSWMREGFVVTPLLLVLLVSICLIAVSIGGNIHRYETNREQEDLIWYKSPLVRSECLSMGAVLWLLVGTLFFTQFMHFTEDRRHLTAIESLYVSVQIVTTVGYGDLTPSSDPGFLFMVFYALIGVTLIITLLQNLVCAVISNVEPPSLMDKMEESETGLGRWKGPAMALAPVACCLLFGTVFFSMYPGEDKTVMQAFYMSAITLLTIGFGYFHPRTQFGMLVASVWMIVGVTCVGGLVGVVTAAIFENHESDTSQIACRKILAQKEASKEKTISRLDFLSYVLVSNGEPPTTTIDINAKYDDLVKASHQKREKQVTTSKEGGASTSEELSFEVFEEFALDLLNKS